MILWLARGAAPEWFRSRSVFVTANSYCVVSVIVLCQGED